LKFLSYIWNWITGGGKKEEGKPVAGDAPVYLPEEKPRKNKHKEQGNARQNESRKPSSRFEHEAQGQKKKQVQQDNPKPKKQKVQAQPQQAAAKPRNLDMTGWEAPAIQRENPDDVLFQDLQLDKRILRALLEELGFKKCSPIQAKALPESLKGSDLAGRAQTGTGKTAAFLITVLQHYLNADNSIRDPWQPMSMILAPTRELAIQIQRDAEAISTYCPEFQVTAVFGGMDFDAQMSRIAKGVDLVVATPGRLLDFIGRE